MKLRSGKTIEKSDKVCGHTCELWHEKCCACSDRRPKNDAYVAYNQSHLDKVSIVARHFRYCPTCKNSKAKKVVTLESVGQGVEQLKKETEELEKKVYEYKENVMLKKETERLKNKVDEQKEVIESLNKTIAIYEAKMAKMENENAVLKKEIEQRDKDEAEMNLYNSGLGELVYHLGYCSDVIGDCWLPHYDSGGLSGLKKSLRETSKFIHKNKSCAECKNMIDNIHD